MLPASLALSYSLSLSGSRFHPLSLVVPTLIPPYYLLRRRPQQLQVLLRHLQQTDPATFALECEGVSPGLRQRHRIAVATVLVADFSEATAKAVAAAAPDARAAFAKWAGVAVSELGDDAEEGEGGEGQEQQPLMSPEAHLRFLESLSAWRQRFSQKEWANVGSISVLRVKNVRFFRVGGWVGGVLRMMSCAVLPVCGAWLFALVG